VNRDIIDAVNQSFSGITFTGGANRIQFQWDKVHGHYVAAMNHDCQKYHEEDVVCAILDTFEKLGWDFKLQYDSEIGSSRVGTGSYTMREQFIFKK